MPTKIPSDLSTTGDCDFPHRLAGLRRLSAIEPKPQPVLNPYRVGRGRRRSARTRHILRRVACLPRTIVRAPRPLPPLRGRRFSCRSEASRELLSVRLELLRQRPRHQRMAERSAISVERHNAESPSRRGRASAGRRKRRPRYVRGLAAPPKKYQTAQTPLSVSRLPESPDSAKFAMLLRGGPDGR